MKPMFQDLNLKLVHALVLGLVCQFCMTKPLQAEENITLINMEDDALLELVDQAIEVSKVRYLDVRNHTAWQILHGLLALRKDYELLSPTGKVNAIDYISNGARLKGSYWFEKTAHGGRAHPYNGVMYDFEGHVNQSLAIIAMSNLPLTHEFKVANNQTVTMQDMVNHAKMNVSSKEEITWTLWFLTHYISQDSEWINAAGEPWSMEKLVKLQNASSVYNTPCGGTHGLFALAYARNAYLQQHGQLRGEWLKGDQKIQQFVRAAQSMQNRDGTFATKFFKAYGHSYEFDERLKSTGHMTEWLMMALPRKRLEERWIRAAVQSIATDMVRNSTKPAECGGMYHALHALILYKQRMAPLTPAQPAKADLASQANPKSGPIVSNKPDDSAYPVGGEPKAPVIISQAKPKTNSEESIKQPPAPATPIRIAEVPVELKRTPDGPMSEVDGVVTPEPYAPSNRPAVKESARPAAKTGPELKAQPQPESDKVSQEMPSLELIPDGLMPFRKPVVIGELEALETEETGGIVPEADESSTSVSTISAEATEADAESQD